jgi:hypothetical protein
MVAKRGLVHKIFVFWALTDGDKVIPPRKRPSCAERQQAMADSRVRRRISRGDSLQAIWWFEGPNDAARQGPVEPQCVGLDDHVELFAVPR